MAGATSKTKADFKLIILGASNVGKTCLIQRYLTGNFAETIASIGASLALKRWGDWNVALWDTAGEEKWASLSSFYCRGAHVALLAFDITSSESLVKLQETFVPLLEDTCNTCLTVVVGAKLDLVPESGRQVQAHEGRKLATTQYQKHLRNALAESESTVLKGIDSQQLYFETSAKTGEGVEEMFRFIQKTLVAHMERTAPPEARKDKSGKKSSTITLESGSQQPIERSGCCKT